RKLLPWQQMMNNGAINPESILIANHEEDSASSEEDNDEILPDAVELELRNYQKELAESALRGENTVICAPTGSGKTRVATYIISNHLMNPGDREKKVAFLARTVPLAEQQYKSLCKYLPSYEITLITGDRKNNMSLHMLLPHSDIVVMTPMILENHLTRKLLSDLGMFSLIVFDECHHTRKGEPYNTLMSSYHKTKHQIHQAKTQGKVLNICLPQIVGLTASIGIERANLFSEAKDNILKVLGNLDVSVISTVEQHKDELRRIVPVATETSTNYSHEKLVILLQQRRDDVAVQRITEIMQMLERQLRLYVRGLNDAGLIGLANMMPANRKLQEYEQWAVKMMTAVKGLPLISEDEQRDMHVRLTVKITQYLI
ncbi:unnamed protein product, partial [Candidula unifasciata]